MIPDSDCDDTWGVWREDGSVRVIMVEPQGEGGICHYSYSLCTALSKTDSADPILATGSPYELADAPLSFAVETPFRPGFERRVVQQVLGRKHRGQSLRSTPSSGTADAASRTSRVPPARKDAVRAEQVPLQATSLAGRMSRWLATREAERGWQRVLRLVRHDRSAVVHVQWLMHPEREYRWLEAFHALGVPVVMTAHNILPHDAAPEARKTWARLYEVADGIIVHYRGGVAELAALGTDLEKVSVIPHGNYCGIQELTQRPGDAMGRREAARQRLGLSPTAPVVLSFGLMRPYKGLQYLLPAFAAVHRQMPDARLILAGRAPNGFQSVQAEIDRLGLGAVTRAFPSYLPLGDVADLFEASDLVVLPYVEASQSGVVHLAYAYSRPVVATRVGGIPEAVIEGETGALVAPRDVDELARAVLTLVRDRELCARLGTQAREFAEDQFAWEPIAERTAQVYERVRRRG